MLEHNGPANHPSQTVHSVHKHLHTHVLCLRQCRCLQNHLDEGVLTELDGAPLVNSSAPSTIMTHLFPITPIELGPGFVIGTDRLITKVSGVFHAPNSSQAAAVYVYADCLQVAEASSGGLARASPQSTLRRHVALGDGAEDLVAAAAVSEA